jgi:hypothetical protein
MLKLYINPKIGAIEISKLSRGDVIKALRSIHAKGKSKSSVGVGMNVVSGVCEYAIDEEHIKDNPCSGVMKRLDSSGRNIPRPLPHSPPRKLKRFLINAKITVQNGIRFSLSHSEPVFVLVKFWPLSGQTSIGVKVISWCNALSALAGQALPKAANQGALI